MIINSPVTRTNDSGMYRVRFYDYDGALLKQQYVASGGAAIAPANPSHSGLTFQEWNKTFSSITRHTDVGATFTPTDGKTHAFVSVNAVTGLAVTLYMNKSDGSTLTVNWGDGNTNTYTNTGAFNTGAHNYAAAGSYEITLDITSGTGTYALGSNSFVGNSTAPVSHTLTELWVGEDARLAQYSCYLCGSLQKVVLPNTISTTMPLGVFRACISLRGLVIPDGVTTTGNYMLYGGLYPTIVVLPDSIVTIADYAFQTHTGLCDFCIPKNVVTIAQYAFEKCYALRGCNLPSTVETIGTYAFASCFGLEGTITIPNACTSLGSYAFYYCYGMEGLVIGSGITTIPTFFSQYSFRYTSLVLGANITAINTNAFANCNSLVSVTIPSGVTSIAASAFTGNYAMREMIMEPTTPPTLANTNAISPYPLFRIYVPNASVAAYKAATNWITYANYIYPISERP